MPLPSPLSPGSGTEAVTQAVYAKLCEQSRRPQPGCISVDLAVEVRASASPVCPS